MSNYCWLACKDCGTFTNSESNHGEEQLLNIIDMAPEIKAIFEKDKFSNVEINISGASEFANFMVEHYGHDVVVRREFGEDLKSK